jgi:glycosyltransferase involved in cell wall biosynthesis
MNKDRLRIEVLMPTYNGERFLVEQLDSILSQQGDFDLRITVRDDGSTDGTREILRHYASQHGVKVILGERIGVNAAIMELVNQADGDADLYAFSDQDDIWYHFRLQEAVTTIISREPGKPILWTCMEELADESLNTYGLMPHPKYLGHFHNAIIQNKAPGHTQVFNRELLDLFKDYPPTKIFVYDWVVYMLASAFGDVI